VAILQMFNAIKANDCCFFINELVKDLIVGVVCQLLIEVLFD
jgi:hypothetical protein